MHPGVAGIKKREELINAVVISENESLSYRVNIGRAMEPKALSGKSEADLKPRMFESILDPKEESCGGFGAQY